MAPAIKQEEPSAEHCMSAVWCVVGCWLQADIALTRTRVPMTMITR